MKLSLKHKTIVLIVSIAGVLALSMITLSKSVMRSALNEEYEDKSKSIASAAATMIDIEDAELLINDVRSRFDTYGIPVTSEQWGSEELNAYLSAYADIEQQDAYLRVRSVLKKIQDASQIKSLYIAFTDEPTHSMVYVVDAAEEDYCAPGMIDRLKEESELVFSSPSDGIPPFITETEEYGALMTAGAPIIGSQGDVIGYVLADISMEEVQARQDAVLPLITGVILMLGLVLAVLASGAVETMLVNPINQLSKAASLYRDDPSIRGHAFDNLSIETGDELQVLAESMKGMEETITDHAHRLTEIHEELDETRTLATKDGLTGIRNKMAYEQELPRLERQIAEGTARFGIAMIDLNYLKRTNDTYGHDMGDESLKAVCRIICSIFMHSPVFRFGGEEFVVLLEHSDYDQIDELTAIFEDVIRLSEHDETAAPWERVSASIGHALYDPKRDHKVEDVFRRADQAMYEHKVAMKSVREN